MLDLLFPILFILLMHNLITVIKLYTHRNFPNHVGILKGQYLEIDWNIFNADLITISWSGFSKKSVVGRKRLSYRKIQPIQLLQKINCSKSHKQYMYVFSTATVG